MANKVYQLEFIKDGKSTQEEIVYTDIDNVIWSLEEEGYIEIGINIYKKAKGGVIIDYAVIKELTHYEGRKLPKENVYLRDNKSEKPTSLKLIRLLAELAYDDLTEQERIDLEIDVGNLALKYKKELENKGEM